MNYVQEVTVHVVVYLLQNQVGLSINKNKDKQILTLSIQTGNSLFIVFHILIICF